MVCEYLEWHSHEVRTELSHRPYNGEAFQIGGGIGFLSLVEGSRSAADDALLAIADLSQDCEEACGQRVGVQPKSLAEVGEGSDGGRRWSGSRRSNGRPRLSWSEHAMATKFFTYRQ